MSAYMALIKIRFSNGLQYRAAALAGFVTQFGFGLLFILQYQAFYHANPAQFPMPFSQMVSYIWVQQAFLMLLMTWFYEEDLFAIILSGHVAYDLSRPMDLYNKWYCQCIAGRLSKTVLRCLPVLCIAFLLPKPFQLVLPANIAQLGLFLLSMILTLGVVVSFSMFIYIGTFYTMSPQGLRIIAAGCADFLAGSIVPIPFFPNGIRQVAQLLPFAAMQNTPLRIYSGNIAGTEAVGAILLQCFWLVTLTLLGKYWMNRTLKKVIIQGG